MKLKKFGAMIKKMHTISKEIDTKSGRKIRLFYFVSAMLLDWYQLKLQKLQMKSNKLLLQHEY